MKMTYEIEGQILVIHQNGVTDAQEINRTIDCALADPGLQSNSHLLWDAVDAPAKASAEKMKTFLGNVRSSSNKLSSRCAMVVATDYQYGVSRMFSAYAEGAGIEVNVFYDFDEARKWLMEGDGE